MHGPHLVYEDEGAGRFVRRDCLSEYRLNLVLVAAQRNDEVRMIVKMEMDAFARFEAHLPHADVFVLQQKLLPDIAQLDAALRRSVEPELVHLSPPAWSG